LRPIFGHIDRYFEEKFRRFEDEMERSRRNWLENWKKYKGDVAAKGAY